MDQINRHSKLPLYHQLYEILRKTIKRGEWLPGDLIPAESELIEMFEVSRTTVRQVLDMLVNEGLIYRQRGRGSFVAHPTLEQGLVRIINFTEDMQQRGFLPASLVLSSDLVAAPIDIAEKLQVPAGEELAELHRLRLADDEPLSIEEAYLVHESCPGILERSNYATASLRDVLDRDYDIRWSRANQLIRAIAATERLAELLAVPPGSPLLVVERVSFTEQGAPLEFLRIYYRADRYSLHNELLP